ncbi:MAG: kynureninase [Cyclobacteriaceae bacterium]
MDESSFEFKNTASFASGLDEADELSGFRRQFSIPEKNGKSVLYFTGNSLGLMPDRAKKLIQQELNKWAEYGVEGHFEGNRPWFTYHELSKEGLARLTGSKPSEVVAMNNLTSNLHLMMVSFFRPDKKRYKIIMEAGAFPSDQYAVESQLRFHGLILETINKNGNETALVLLSGVQYFTGQKFNISAITRAAHDAGAFAGFDLAHAIGNVELNLHNDDVDFAVWCTYKYLNSGPGSVSGIFVHERHGDNIDIPRFAGWWGHDQEARFLMKKGFVPMKGADGWQLSNVNILGTAGHVASLQVFADAGWDRILKKSRKLHAFLRFLLTDILEEFPAFTVLTPEGADEHGCQLSLHFPKWGRSVFRHLSENGVIADWREDNLLSKNNSERPGVIRIAPVPLYNTFQDLYQFSVYLRKALKMKYENQE